MARISFSNTGNTNFQRLLGHNEEVLNKWVGLEDAFLNNSLLDLELKEEVRMALASSNQCHY